MNGAVTRRGEIEANLAGVRRRIAAACQAAGRTSAEITLIGVTKTWPVPDVRLLAELGVADMGENRHEELVSKAAACVDLDLRWHFVGQLQTNKCRAVAAHAHVVHSVDRDRLVATLGREADRAGRVVSCLVQIDLDERPGRGGVAPGEATWLADNIAGTEGLVLGGVMAMAPRDGDPTAAFQRLAEVAKRVQQEHPAARAISAGMSGDLESAIMHGATHLRIGTALLGFRGNDVG